MNKLLRTNNSKRAREKPQNLVHTEEPAPTQPDHYYTTENKSGGQTDPQITSWRQRPTKESLNKNQKPKTYTEPT